MLPEVEHTGIACSIMKKKDRTKNRGNEDETFGRGKDQRQEHNERD